MKHFGRAALEHGKKFPFWLGWTTVYLAVQLILQWGMIWGRECATEACKNAGREFLRLWAFFSSPGILTSQGLVENSTIYPIVMHGINIIVWGLLIILIKAAFTRWKERHDI